MHVSIGPRFSRAQKLLIALTVVLVVGFIGFVMWRLFIVDDSRTTKPVVDADTPPHLVSLTESSMTVANLDGTEARTAELPPAFAAMLVVDQGRWLVEDNRDTVVNYFDLSAAQPELRSVELPFAGWAIHPRTVRVGNDIVLLYSPDGSLGLAVVNLADGTAYPIASARAKYFLAGSVRDYLLFKDVDGINTVIVPVADPTAFWTMKGAVVDIRGTTTLVATVNGLASYLTMFDGPKTVGVRVQVENPIMGGMLIDTGALVLERSGALSSLDFVTGKVKRAGVSPFGAQGAIPVADNRLYGWGGDGSALVGADGVPLANYVLGPSVVADTEGPPMVATDGGTGCLVLQPGPQLKSTGASAILISTVDGAELLEMDASPNWVSPDGCTLVGLDSTVVINGKVVDVDLDRVFSVSRDGASVLGVRNSAGDGTTGTPTFVLLDVASGETTKLESATNLFATF